MLTYNKKSIQMEQRLTYTNFLPLIGPFHWAAKAMGMECVQTVSYPKMQGNEQHIKANDPSAPDPILLPDNMLDDFTFDLSNMQEKIRENNIKKTDFVFALPPCSGFSMMSTTTASDSKANICMIEAIKYYIVSDSEVLLFENAPGLAGEKGQVFLRDYVYKMLEHNDLINKYKFTLFKTDTDQHGLPQHRPRTFMIMYKSDKHKKVINTEIITHKTIEKLFEDLPFEEDPSTQHTYLRSKLGDEYLDYINNSPKGKKVIEEVYKTFEGKSDWRYDIITTLAKKILNHEAIADWKFDTKTPQAINSEHDSEILDDAYPLLNKSLTTLREKIYRKGMFTFRDSGPILFKDYTSALVGKNNWNLTRTFKDGRMRYLTFREKARLMGYPDSFKLVDLEKNNNHICQNAPLTTVTSAIKWAIQILENKDIELINLEKPYIFLYQRNTKSEMNKEVFAYDSHKFVPLNKTENEKDIFDGFI